MQPLGAKTPVLPPLRTPLWFMLSEYGRAAPCVCRQRSCSSNLTPACTSSSTRDVWRSTTWTTKRRCKLLRSAVYLSVYLAFPVLLNWRNTIVKQLAKSLSGLLSGRTDSLSLGFLSHRNWYGLIGYLWPWDSHAPFPRYGETVVKVRGLGGLSPLLRFEPPAIVWAP